VSSAREPAATNQHYKVPIPLENGIRMLQVTASLFQSFFPNHIVEQGQVYWNNNQLCLCHT
jgi:hypothetical protein